MGKDYQKLTEEIVENGGLQTDNRIYFDPIYASWKQGDFLRNLSHSVGHPLMKIFASIIIFILPAIAWIIGTFFSNPNNSEISVIMQIAIFILVLLFLFVSIKLLMSGYKDLFRKGKK